MNKPASTQTSKAVGLAQEIELKLDVGPGPIQPLLDLSLWANQTTANLSAVYFDTPELTLYRAGLSLRVRQGVQTLKVTNRPASKAMMGLFDRAEWEHPLEGQTPDLSLLCGTPLDTLVYDPCALIALIEVGVTRRRVLIDWGHSQIELCLDQGTVVAGGLSDDICELELELIKGQSADLFSLAKAISLEVRLIPSRQSKADRGIALLTAKPSSRIVKAQSRSDLRGLSRSDAFAALALESLSQIIANSEILRRDRAPEAVHQMRVGLRRLRVLLGLFKTVAVDADLPGLKADLKALSLLLGPARDIDVLLPHLRALKPSPASLVAAIIQARTKAYDAACDYINSPAYGQLVVGLLGWLDTGGWRSAANTARLAALEHAGNTLERLRKKLQKRSRGLAQMGEAQIHELRIQAKKLRYAAEMFASLYPHKTPIRRKWVSAIKTLQDQLGAANDRAVGQGLLIAHAPTATSEQIDHWISALWPQPTDTRAKAQKTLDVIFDLPSYWRADER